MDSALPRSGRERRPGRRASVCAAGAALAALLPLAALVEGQARPTAVDVWLQDAVQPVHPVVVVCLDVVARRLPPLVPLVAVTLAVGCWRSGRTRSAVLCLAGPTAASLSTAALKPLLARPAVGGEGWMFPSGHVTVVAAVALVGALLLRQGGAQGGWPRRAAWLAVVGAPAATSLGTVVARHHHPTDVVGALLVAVAAVLLVAVALARPGRS